MLTESMLATARAAAESLMTATCTITRASGPPTWDEATGTRTDLAPIEVYVGPCKVQDSGRATGEVNAGEREVGVFSRELHLPVDGSGAVRRDDVATIVTNPADPALVGQRFIVQGPHGGTWKSARRLSVEAVA